MKNILAVAFLCLAMPVWAQSLRLVGENRRTVERCNEAAELTEKQRWDDALTAYLKIIEDAGAEWLPSATDSRLWKTAREVVFARIAARPELATRYRDRFESEAKRQLALASGRRDVVALRRLTTDHAPCSAAAEAWDLLGDLAFERGDFVAARHAWRQAGDTPLLQAKSILAGFFLGEPQEAALDAFRQRHGGAKGRLAGRNGSLTEILIECGRDSNFSPAVEANRPRMYAVDAARRGQLADPIPAGAPDVVLPPISLPGGDESDSPTDAPKAKTSPSLVYHPLVWRGQAVVCDGARLSAFDLRTGDPAHQFEVNQSRRNPRRPVAVPRPTEPTTLATDGPRLYARLGVGETSHVVALTAQAGEQFRFESVWTLSANQVAEAGVGTAQVDGCPTPCDGKLYIAWSRTNAARVTHGITCVRAEEPGEKPIWRQIVAESTRDAGQRAHPVLLCIAGPNVVMNTDAGAVIALDAETGRRVWSYQYVPRPTKNVGADLMTVTRDLAPCVAADGRLFAAPADCGDVLGFDQFTGVPLWPQSLGLETVHLLGVVGERLFVTADGIHRGVAAVNVARGQIDPRWGSLSSERPFGRGLLFQDGLLWPTHSQGLIPLRFDQQPAPIPTVLQRLAGGNLAYADGYLLVATENQLHILRWKQPQRMAVQPPRALAPRDPVRLLASGPAPRLGSLVARRLTELPPGERPLLAESSDVLLTADAAAVWRDVPSGEMRWRTPLDFEPTWAIATETGYIVAGAGGATALDRVTGRPAWSWTTEESLAGFRAAERRLFATAGTRQIVALDLADGQPLWRHSVAPETVYPLLEVEGATLLSQTSGGRARMLDTATGRIRAVVPTSLAPWRTPPIRLPDGALVLPGPIDRLSAIDSQSGELFWSHDLASAIDNGGAAFSTRWLDDALWLLAETPGGGVLRRIDPRTGRIAASDPQLPAIRGLASFQNLARRDEALVIAAGDQLMGYDANTGRRRWMTKLPVDADWCVRPAEANQWLVFTANALWRWAEPGGGYQWTALIVDDREGKPRQRYDLPAREPRVVTGGDARTWVVAVAGRVAEFESTGEAK